MNKLLFSAVSLLPWLTPPAADTPVVFSYKIAPDAHVLVDLRGDVDFRVSAEAQEVTVEPRLVADGQGHGVVVTYAAQPFRIGFTSTGGTSVRVQDDTQHQLTTRFGLGVPTYHLYYAVTVPQQASVELHVCDGAVQLRGSARQLVVTNAHHRVTAHLRKQDIRSLACTSRERGVKINQEAKGRQVQLQNTGNHRVTIVAKQIEVSFL